MTDIRTYLFEKLSDEDLYSVYQLFRFLAELLNIAIENANFLGYNIEEIEKIVLDEHELNEIFKRRRVESEIKFSDGTYLMNKVFVFDLLDEVEHRIELQVEKFYSVKNVLKRLEYPANLDKYYFDESWSDFDKTYIQRIIKNDYDGVHEFPKQYSGWVIYGSDEKFKDATGKHNFRSNTFEPRPEGYAQPKAGLLEYLMNREYVKNLANELERRKFITKHKSSLQEIKSNIASIERMDIVDFSENFLTERQDYYLQELKKLDIEKSNRISQYNSMIQRIKLCASFGYFDYFDVLGELNEKMTELNSLKKFNASYKILLKKVIERVEEKSLSNQECQRLIAKSLYNKQNKYEKDLKKYRQRVVEAIGECVKTKQDVLLALKKIKQNLSGEKLNIFMMLLEEELELAEFV